MNRYFLPITAFLVACAGASAEEVPAFPGAEGFGRYVTGGRGGKIVHVTNLNDSGAGSLREAVKGNTAKIVVFDVGGYIDLKSDLTIGSNTTIAGQTAPGEGITLRYFTVKPEKEGTTQNVIIRFIRSRRSQVKNVNDGADALYFRNCKKLMFDHCSFSWSIDEVASCYDNALFTMQWCTLGEGLANAGHGKGAHSYGGIWGGKEASFHHNFLCHMQNRVPRFNGARYEWDGFDKTRFENTVQAEQVDFRNCVMYNWGTGGCYGGPGGGYINMVNNYYKAGPGTKTATRVTTVSIGESGNSTPSNLYGYSSRYYINGNYVASASTPASYDWKGVAYDSGFSTIGGERYIKDAAHLYGSSVEYLKDGAGVDCVSLKLSAPIPAGEVSTHDAQAAYDAVLEYCGASLHRDGVDVRYMEEARTKTVNYLGNAPAPGSTVTSGTKGIIDYINDPDGTENTKTASYPALETASRPDGFDTDRDGMPDAWELANGLNPNDASDAALYTVDTRGWYPNIEVYLNSIVESIMKGGNAKANAIDEYYPISSSSSASIVVPDGNVKTIEYYTLQGVRLSEPAEGVNIRRIVYNNGRVETDKVLK